MLRCLPILLLALLCVHNTQAGDQKREAEFAQLLMQSTLIGKPLQLEADGKKFLNLYTETEKSKSQGTVILLHDIGGHPNQNPVIAGLRTYLPEHNWTTLSLQMPVREVGSEQAEYYPLFTEALARIQAGVKYAKDKGSATIVLTGYGLGALMAAYAQSEQGADIAGLIAISLPVPKTSAKTAQTLEFIKKIKTPMLDIYGAFDGAEVRETARDRRLAGKDNVAYRQIMINDESHTY
ncbi:MAG: DUF3530 family protein, partial [Methylococcales bacterium]